MTNGDPDPRRLRLATASQRLFALAVLALFAWLIWAALSGRYDAEVDRFAAWLEACWHGLIDWIARTWHALFG